MTITDPPQPTALDVAVEQVWEMVLSQKAADTAEAAKALWHSVDLDVNDREYLGILGLAEYATLSQRHTRRSGVPGIAVGAPHGKKWDAYLTSLTWVYDDASGTPKPLIDFTQADWAAFVMRMSVQVETYAARATLGRKAAALLTEYGKTRLRDLPKAEQRKFADEAKDVLGRRP